MTEIKVAKQELSQDNTIKFILDNTSESSTFRTYKTMNYLMICVDIVPMEKELQ